MLIKNQKSILNLIQVKSNLILLLLSFSFLPVLAQEKLTVETCMVSGPLTIQKPVTIDSVNIFGASYDLKQMLKTNISPVAFRHNAFTMAVNTATGFFSVTPPLPSPKGNETSVSFYFFNFTVTASSFAKAKLKITSPQALEVYVDDEKVTEKQTVQNSLDNALSAEWSMTLEPRCYNVTVKCLVQGNDTLKPSVKMFFEAPDLISLAKLQITPTLDKRPFTLNDVLEGERPSSISISADGKYALQRSTIILPKGRRSTTVKIINLATGKSILNSSEDRGWVWMPKGSRLYFTTTGIKGRELRVVDVATNQETTVAESLPEGSFVWSPDESFLIFSITDKAPDNIVSGARQILTPQDRQADWRNRSFLYRYDLATGVLQQLVFGYRTAYLSAISPDAQKIIFNTSKDNYSERPFSLNTVCMLNLADMKVDTLWHDIKYGSVASFSPDGKQLLLTGGPESFDNIGKCPKVKGIPNSYDTQAYIYDISTRNIKPITLNFNPSIERTYWSKADNNIYFVVTDEDYRNCYRYNTRRETFEKIALPTEFIQGFALANDVPIAVGVGQTASYPSTAFMIDLRNNRTTQLDNPMKPVMDKIQLGKIEDWNFQSSLGDEIKGRIYYPYNFDKDKKYPLIVYYYGGTTPVNRTFDGRYPFHLYATMGYMVYVLQPSGAVGFGQEFSARHVNAWGKYTADEIIEGTQKLCDAFPFIDRTKIGCIGASYGGFMTMYLLTKTDLFSSAISHAGISDITSYWGEGYWGYAYSGAASAESYPWNNKDLYVGQSPLFAADKIKTPLLLLHGAVDTNVPPGESIQMFTALKILGVPVELITIENEDHHIADYNRRIRWNNSIFAWFAKWLQDDNSWWNDMYPKKNL